VSERPDYPVEAEREQPVIRDKRRIDPLTGAVRDAGPVAAGAAAPAGGPADPPAGAAAGTPGAAAPGDDWSDDVATELQLQIAERTADLQRLQAEYANYRRRVDRDREAVREAALANVLTSLLPVLDDIGRARDHGELEGGFKAVAEALEGTIEKLGLQRFGAEGDPFDPTVHEALTHELRSDVSETTCVRVFQVGYRIGERVVRPARVAVAEPDEDAASTAADSTAAASTAAGSTAADGAAGAGDPDAPGADDTGAPATDADETARQ
jgi:molecular chaperone GrpE